MLLKEIKNIKSTVKELREFGYVVGGVLLGVSLISAWKHGWSWNPYLIVPGAALVALGLLWPSVLKPLQKVWMGIALVMGWVMSRVILTLMFLLIVTPLALFLRARGKRFLERRPDPAASTYWKARGTDSFDPRRCERQY